MTLPSSRTGIRRVPRALKGLPTIHIPAFEGDEIDPFPGPIVIGIVSIVISVVAFIASGLPGVRSAFIDPAAALRVE